ncbi:MAG: SDR family oxidoreductase [Magnetococcus sp. WYHC-3]
MEACGHGALVTGAGQRIGRALAESLAERGVAVAVHYHRSAEAAHSLCRNISQHGGVAVALQQDLGDTAGVPGLLDRAWESLGRPVDILVNSASIFRRGDLVGSPVSEWQTHLDINLTAPMTLMQRFVQRLGSTDQEGSSRPRQGKIVNLLDRRVVRPSAGHLAYSVSKTALWELTRQAALELAPWIQVNGIGPGAILPAATESAEQFAAMVAATPARRPGRVAEIVSALWFFLENDYVTGELLCVDGGQHLL